MTNSTLCFRAASLFLLAGMIWGLQMAISNNHATFPAHAHLNLLGFVSLFMFGIYYRLHPALETNRMATTQVWIWIAATAVIALGVGLIFSGQSGAEPIAAGGSIVAFLDAILFAWLVFGSPLGAVTVTDATTSKG